MDEQELTKLIERLIDEKIEELELEQFAEDTANIVVELYHDMEDIKKGRKDAT